ncbi:M14 family metallopeptidase [Neobacillus jeddahensis]|uniref:M14 family metallopeptidase n=1 Tax=Neobacillus jeddahensis TaxID=1461580 RepID=UPI00058EAF48|nr:M14 family metallopeptidase [Neobacillus jeddahensis]
MMISVRPGDTLSYYSKLFRIPVNLIEEANPKVDSSNLKVAEKIVIPGYVTVPYTIQAGNTIWELAITNKIAEDTLFLLNPTKDVDQLKVGETLFVPEKIVTPFVKFHSPLNYKRLEKLIQSFKKVYPFIRVTTIGTSVEGKPIQEIRIGKGAKKIHINASFHANEWITTMVLMSIVNNYLLSLTNGTVMNGQKVNQWYEDIELSIVPMVNPDGVDLVVDGPPAKLQRKLIEINDGCDDFIHWKANISGVDLNNQFPANWDICRKNKLPKAPAPRDFPGEAPLTEPEAIAMAKLAENNRFDLIIALHTQGEEFYWGYEGYEPEEAEALAKEIEYFSGYQAIRYVKSHAGYKDWFIQEFKRPGFTIELGKGINPLPLSQFPEILKRGEAIFSAVLSH